MSTPYYIYVVFLVVFCSTACQHKSNKETFSVAYKYLKKSMWRESKTVFKKLYKKNPNNFKVTKYLGIVNVKTGDYNNAIGLLGKTIKKSPNDNRANYFLAEAYRLVGNYSPAIYHYKLVLSGKPKNMRALQGIAWCFYRIQYYNDAYLYAKKLMSLYPNVVDSVVLYGRVLLKLQKKQQLNILLRAALKKYKSKREKPHIDSLVGEYFLYKNELKKANKYFTRAIKVSPLLVSALIGKSKILLEYDMIKQATKYLERAHRLDPEQEEVHLYLAMIYEKTFPDKSFNHYRIFYNKAKSNPEYKDEIKKVIKRIENLAYYVKRNVKK